MGELLEWAMPARYPAVRDAAPAPVEERLANGRAMPAGDRSGRRRAADQGPPAPGCGGWCFLAAAVLGGAGSAG